jgi:hypothetical protein
MKSSNCLAFILLAGPFAVLAATSSVPMHAADATPPMRVLFFSKASSWEHKLVHRDRPEELSPIEQAMAKLGSAHGIEFTFSKDGTIFTAANLAKFDALFFYTSGDLTSQPRTGRGDNFPLMTLEGKRAFLDAIDGGLGFVGCNTANYTFPERLSPGEKDTGENSWRFTRMIGAGFMGHNEVQRGVFSYLDRKFPGMESVPADYQPVDQWYAFRHLAPDMHVIMALDSRRLTGNLYERESYPIAWARTQGKGRVFYTTMGHALETWRDPVFLQMLLGGIRWTTRQVDTDITPDIATVTPQATEIPERASKFIPEHPPVIDPHFPNFKVWLEKPWPMHGHKRVLVYTKSSGIEPPIVYRDTAWPSPLEKELLGFGDEHEIDFVFTKDGTLFTDEGLAGFDAILFFTSGDPTTQPRNGLGDNYPLLASSGIDALLHAVRAGKGFLSVHSEANIPPMRELVGGKVMPDAVPQFEPMEGREWNSVQKSPEGSPLAWTRNEGDGRVFATVLGRDEEEWKSAPFRALLLAALRWATHDSQTPPTTAK